LKGFEGNDDLLGRGGLGNFIAFATPKYSGTHGCEGANRDSELFLSKTRDKSRGRTA
jgi:hypothetical protein